MSSSMTTLENWFIRHILLLAILFGME